jgi:DNA-directed RNA polymerase specialized sigma24 family protein
MPRKKIHTKEETAAAVKIVMASASSMDLLELGGLSNYLYKLFSNRCLDHLKKRRKARKKADECLPLNPQDRPAFPAFL